MSSTLGDILVVDDQPVNVRLLATMLSQLGYKVRKATSGEMALTAIHAEPPDLILLDITMPQMDGYELCEILKKNPQTAEIPVIFVSALDESMDKTKAFEVGAADYVAKPFQWAEVQARVKTQLALRQLQQLPPTSNFAELQSALWAESMPAIAHFEFAALPSASFSVELFDWQPCSPDTLHLTLARSESGSPLSAILLAEVRGLFKGLSLENSLQERFQRALALMEPDLQGTGDRLRLFHGELHGDDRRALSYVARGYTLALVRQQIATARAAAATLAFEPGDRLFIFSADLQSAHLQLTESLMSCDRHWTDSTSSAAMFQQVAAELKGATGYEGSILMLYCPP
ncbi:response regulator [Altericista sp. CCNU0014]|uniref:response regulator n=1 Tax=Altericista sp. CCNU0014 TaxID=3082949 RepID=UPI00384B17D0